MSKFKLFFNSILKFIYFTTIFFQAEAKSFDYHHKSANISNYFNGILSGSDNDYINSYKFLRKLNGLENTHINYSQVYLNSLVNLQKFNEAFRYAKKIEDSGVENFQGQLIIALYHLKNKKFKDSLKYLEKIKNNKNKNSIENLIGEYLLVWGNLKFMEENQAKILFNTIPSKLENLHSIQNAFLSCHFDTQSVDQDFKKLFSNSEIDYSRYHFFYSNYLKNKGDLPEARSALEKSIKRYPSNLLLRQLELDIQRNNAGNDFNCKNIAHINGELFYIISNVLSSREMYSRSNFYLHLAKYLNPNFTSYDVLYAENLFFDKNYLRSKNVYKKIINNDGEIYQWHSAKQLAVILSNEDKEKASITLMEDSFKKIKNPTVQEMYEYASFLKNNEKFSEAIGYYSKILNLINKDNALYPKVTDGRGVSYERLDNWGAAEKDFLNSLMSFPNQPYVINYLAYSWIEKGINIKKSLAMLEKANELKKNDGYITDSLGWAFFKLKKYKEAKKYLQLAVRVMPADPTINDHFGDSLWMLGKKIQARYYWNYVLNLDKTEEALKKQILKKMINGPKTSL